MTELHPAAAARCDVKGRAAIFDLDVDVLFGADKEEISFMELPRYPDVPFDVSVLADRMAYAGEMSGIIASSAPDYVRSVSVVSVYEGSPVPEGKKSVSFRIVFAAKDRTLTTEEIDGRKIEKALYKLEELELMVERGDLK